MLIDANPAKAEGEAMNLNHTVPFAFPTRVWAGDFSDCEGASVTVFAVFRPGTQPTASSSVRAQLDYAVAAGLIRITQAILRNQSTVLSVSSLINDYYRIR